MSIQVTNFHSQIVSTTQPAAATVVTSDSVALFLPTNVVGSTWNDSSTYGNHLTLSNTSYANNELTFDSSKYAFAFRNAITGTPRSQMTITAWVKSASVASIACLFSLNRWSSNHLQEMVVELDYNLYKFWDYSDAYSYNTAINVPIISNTYYQITFVKNGKSGRYYLNGSLANSVSSNTDVVYGSSYFCIGKDYRDNNAYFNGKLKFFGMYNRALSAEEIVQNYQAMLS